MHWLEPQTNATVLGMKIESDTGLWYLWLVHKQLHNDYVIVSNSSDEKSKSLPIKSYSLKMSFKIINFFSSFTQALLI